MKSSRLKNFCEVCRKQCRDENGYHCHLNSARHQKKLRELATNPEEHIEKYSKQLQNRIVQMLKVKYPGQPKNIEDLYEQYTEDKHYVRFNHTRWKDLNEFVDHLRKNVRNLQIKGSPPNVKITYLVSKAGDFIRQKREQELFEKREKQKQMLQSKMDEKIARSREIEEGIFNQMKRRLLQKQQKLQEFNGDTLQIKLDMDQHAQKRSKLFDIEQMEKELGEDLNYAPKKIKNVEKLFEKLQNEEKVKHKKNEEPQAQADDEYQWIVPGIIVKILPHQIPQVFHGKKVPIKDVKEPFVASVQVGNAHLQIDQTYLETVIPKSGHDVKILRGDFKGEMGSLMEVDIQKGIGQIKLKNSEHLLRIPFNQFSKSA